MRKTIFCVVSAAFLLLAISCSTMEEIITTVPNMRAAEAAERKRQATLAAQRKEELEKEALRQQIQAEIIAENAAKEVVAEPAEVSENTAERTAQPERDLFAPRKVEGTVCGENIKVVLQSPSSVEVKYPVNVNQTLQNEGVSFIKEICGKNIDEVFYTAEGVRLTLTQSIPEDLFLENTPYIIEALDLHLRSLLTPKPKQEGNEIVEVITPPVEEKTVVDESEPVIATQDWQSAVTSVPVSQPQDDSRLTKAPVPADDSVNKLKAGVAKPPALDKQGLGLLAIVIAIAATSAMIVYFVLLRKKKD